MAVHRVGKLHGEGAKKLSSQCGTGSLSCERSGVVGAAARAGPRNDIATTAQPLTLAHSITTTSQNTHPTHRAQQPATQSAPATQYSSSSPARPPVRPHTLSSALLPVIQDGSSTHPDRQRTPRPLLLSLLPVLTSVLLCVSRNCKMRLLRVACRPTRSTSPKSQVSQSTQPARALA